MKPAETLVSSFRRVQMEEWLTETGKEGRVVNTSGILGCHIVADGARGRSESDGEREPEGTERSEDSGGERVAEKPFAQTAQQHERATEAVVETNTGGANGWGVAGASPAHEVTGDWGKA